MRARSYRALLIVLCATACASSSQNLLVLDGSDAAGARLCDLEMKDDGDIVESDCAPLGGQKLRAPGQLALRLENADPTGAYSAQVEAESRGPSDQQPGAVFDEFMKRVAGIASETMNGITQREEDPDQKQSEARSAVQSVLDRTLKGAGIATNSGIRRLRKRIVGSEQAEGGREALTSDQIFGQYVYGDPPAPVALHAEPRSSQDAIS